MIKVLIVDDDKLARKGIISFMPWDKYNMKIIGDVQNGRVALEFLQMQEADIMFIDIDMPELGGIGLMEECRKKFPEVQFVVLTFYEEFSYAQAAIRHGVLDYISKVQMEKEDGDSILKRVLHNYKLRKTPAVNNMENYPNQEEWDVVKKEWLHLFWIYDTVQFEILINKTKLLKPDNRELERILIKCIQSIDNNLEREETMMPFLTEVDLVLNWLKEWRDSLYEYALAMTRNESMQICIIRAITYLKLHLPENLKAEEVADEIGMSRSYFSINFKKLTGKTFHEYVKQERMSVAAGLLAKTDKKIIDIAKESGFDDINYFNRVFHEVMKSSPTDFRKKLFQL